MGIKNNIDHSDGEVLIQLTIWGTSGEGNKLYLSVEPLRFMLVWKSSFIIFLKVINSTKIKANNLSLRKCEK
jgi:hypothetical protein